MWNNLFGKLLVLSLLIASLAVTIAAQDEEYNPVKWSFKAQISNAPPKSGDIFKVELTAEIEKGWHLYSTNPIENGPRPTRITIPAGQGFERGGDITAPDPIVSRDPNFSVETEYYNDQVTFTLPVKVLADISESNNKLQIQIRYQSCNERLCLPPKLVKLEVQVQTADKTISNAAAVSKTVQTSSSKMPVADFAFTDFDGKQRKFSDFKGKIVLLDFWATWCSPCLADIPKLKVLYEKYKSQGFEIIGMDSETIGDDETPDPEFAKETSERAKQIVKTRGANWTHANSETAVPIAKKIFDVKALPTKILIDKDGKIVARIGEKDDLEKAVVELMEAK